jgi:hypothetical protein
VPLVGPHFALDLLNRTLGFCSIKIKTNYANTEALNKKGNEFVRISNFHAFV